MKIIKKSFPVICMAISSTLCIEYTGRENEPYTEYFNTSSISDRWMPFNESSPMQFDQNEKRWSMHWPDNMKLNAPLPDHPTGAFGLVSTLS